MRKSILIIFPFCGDYIHEKTEKGEHLARYASSSKRSELHAKARVAGDMHLMVRDILRQCDISSLRSDVTDSHPRFRIPHYAFRIDPAPQDTLMSAKPIHHAPIRRTSCHRR